MAHSATVLLAEYRSLVDALAKKLQDGDEGAVPTVLEQLIEVDTNLQQAAGTLLAKREQHERAKARAERAAERKAELLELASKLQQTESELGALAKRGREALLATDESLRDGRAVPVAALVEYAERVSYSNAAPRGTAAFATAEKDAFRGGWGTPAPQQHMLAVSRFAEIARRTASADRPDDAPAAAGSVRAEEPPPAEMPMAGWKPGDPVPAPPAGWKPGDPIPAPPQGWKPGDPIPAPPAGWKPGDPIPAPPPGWKPGAAVKSEPSAPAASTGKGKPSSVRLGLADSDDEDDV